MPSMEQVVKVVDAALRKPVFRCCNFVAVVDQARRSTVGGVRDIGEVQR